jgi:hypothetical protein
MAEHGRDSRVRQEADHAFPGPYGSERFAKVDNLKFRQTHPAAIASIGSTSSRGGCAEMNEVCALESPENRLTNINAAIYVYAEQV